MTDKSFYIFGLQRSGTNFVENIMRVNFKSAKLNRGIHHNTWKHSIDVPDGYDPSHFTIVIHKNPYTWIESISLRSNVDWEQTQTTYPARQIEDRRFVLGEKRKFNVLNLCRTYKHFHDTWLPRADLVIRYEDMLVTETRNKILEKIENSFERTFPQKEWSIPQKGAISLSKDYNDDREKYYIAGKPQHMNDRTIFMVNRIITTELISDLGYDVL